MTTETLTARTMMEDGRVTCALVVDDGPPTWVKIFGNIGSARRFAEVYNLEFINATGVDEDARTTE